MSTTPLLLSMFLYSLGMSITPGPVNMVILSSGINHGMKKTIPYVSGATIGFTLLLLFVGFGFLQVINAYPFLLKYLAYIGSAFIIYVGYKVTASTAKIEMNKERARPKFYEGFLLQWLNPKSWIACASGAAIFSSSESHIQFLTFVSIYFLVCYSSLALWAVLGDKMSLLLKNGTRLRLFNILMGSLLILTASFLCFTI